MASLLDITRQLQQRFSENIGGLGKQILFQGRMAGRQMQPLLRTPLPQPLQEKLKPASQQTFPRLQDFGQSLQKVNLPFGNQPIYQKPSVKSLLGIGYQAPIQAMPLIQTQLQSYGKTAERWSTPQGRQTSFTGLKQIPQQAKQGDIMGLLSNPAVEDLLNVADFVPTGAIAKKLGVKALAALPVGGSAGKIRIGLPMNKFARRVILLDKTDLEALDAFVDVVKSGKKVEQPLGTDVTNIARHIGMNYTATNQTLSKNIQEIMPHIERLRNEAGFARIPGKATKAIPTQPKGVGGVDIPIEKSRAMKDVNFVSAEKSLKRFKTDDPIGDFTGYLTTDGTKVKVLGQEKAHKEIFKEAGIPGFFEDIYNRYGGIRVSQSTQQTNIHIGRTPTSSQLLELSKISDKKPVIFDFYKNGYLEKSSPSSGVSKSDFLKQIGDTYDLLTQPKGVGGVREILKRKYPEVNFFVYEKEGKISLDKIIIPKEQRNQGIGTKFMEDLTKYADETGQKLVTTPTSDFGGSKSRLVDFYKRFGFTENKGRKMDYSISETMIREPQPKGVGGGVYEPLEDVMRQTRVGKGKFEVGEVYHWEHPTMPEYSRNVIVAGKEG